MSSGLLVYRRLPGGHYRIPEESIRNLWGGEDSSNLDGRRRPQKTGWPSADVSGVGETRVRRSRRRLGDEGADSYDLMPVSLRSKEGTQDGGNVVGIGFLGLQGRSSELSDLRVVKASRAA
jgi:hypothetical protein